MGSPVLTHDLKKFADQGLQLRLPVDLVPATQYVRLTNCIPTIEGEIRTREGLVLISLVVQSAALSMLERPDTSTLNASIADTIYPHGYIPGDTVVIIVTDTSAGDTSTATPGTYTRTVTAVPTTNQFVFTPVIPVVWDPAATSVRVFAQVQSNDLINTLASTAISLIYRLNQGLQTIPGDILIGIFNRLFRAQLPGGNMFQELVLPSLAGAAPIDQNGFSGHPLSIASFRFTLAQETWAIIADTNKMAKFRESGDAQDDALFFRLGNPVPITPASAVIAGAGNLTGDYDWRYTYYDGYVGTEGNPSPGTDSGTIETVFSTAQVNPVPAHNTGGSFAYTNLAFTGVSNVGGTGHNTQDGGRTPITANSFNQASCIWKGFPNPTTTPFVITLSVTWSATINKPDVAPIQVQLQYSTNAGASFRVMGSASSTSGETTTSVNLPLGTDLTQVQFQCWGFCNAHFSGGTFIPGGYFTIPIANIQINCNLSPTSSVLTLAAQSASVTVTGPGVLNDGRVTGIRLYRRGGTLNDAYRLVGTYPLDSLTSATFGPETAGTGTTNPSSGSSIAWTNPNNVTSAVGFATCALAAGEQAALLSAETFGFSIITGNIAGVHVTAELLSTTPGVVLHAVLLKGGLGASATELQVVPTVLGTLTFGGATDKFSAVLTPADISQSGFGVAFITDPVPAGGATVSLRNVQITVFVDDYFVLTDNVDDTTLSTSPIMELDNDAPVTSVSVIGQPLSQVWGPVGLEARMLGCGDPGRPEAVYFSKPGNADAWPPQNWISVSDPGSAMIAGCVFNTQNYAFSRERCYQLIEGYVPGITFTPFQTPSAHGLFCPTGLTVGPQMFFVAKDGIYASSGGVETSLVENDIKPLFPTYDKPEGEDVNGYEAVDMTLPDNIHLQYHNDELYFAYTGATTATRQMLVYDLLKKRWRAVHYAAGASAIYSEPNTTSTLLVGSDGGGLYSAAGTVDPDQLDVIEGINIASVATSAVTLPASNYYVRLVRITLDGEVAMSNEFPGIVVNATHGIGMTIPLGPEDTTAWRLYYGIQLGLEDQYALFNETSLAISRVIVVKTVGALGSPPTTNADNRIVVNLRTGSHDQGQPLNRKQYSNLLADLNPASSDISITPIIDGETQTQAAIIVSGVGRQQFPLDLSDYFAFNTEYEYAWHRDPTDPLGPQLFQYDTLHYLEPVGLKHWSLQPSAFGFPGYMHMRDAYIAIRSTADVVLTLKLDGGLDAAHVQTYIVPSTGGVRQKVYVQFASNKAKQYELSLDSAEEFRTYDSDLELRTKPWLGVLGYAVLRPFAEGSTG